VLPPELAVGGGPDGVYQRLMGSLAQVKQQRRVSAPLLGQGVTLACRATGMPAVAFDEREQQREGRERPISAEVRAKIARPVVDRANARLREALPQEAKDVYELTLDLDKLGRSFGENSYIAVVHADGNRMGQRFKSVTDHHITPGEGNRACLEAIRDLSEAVEGAGRAALERMFARMVAAFQNPGSEALKEFHEDLPQEKENGKRFLPIRPLVFGGDDLTFVCDGRLGLPLAAIYLEEFEKATEGLPQGGKAYACAGVAIVKVHYPFYRAYVLCEELCRGAKAALREADDLPASAMDWQFTTTGITGTPREMRALNYKTPDGQLQMRPVTLRAPGFDDWRSWHTLKQGVEGFGDEYWGERKNAVIGLREALRGGPNQTERFRVAHALKPLPTLNGVPEPTLNNGWKDERCAYFDPIEALDYYLPLQVSDSREL
jgi:hypothetical protein